MIFSFFKQLINNKPFEFLLWIYYTSVVLTFIIYDYDSHLTDILNHELMLFIFLSILLLLLIIYKKTFTTNQEIQFLAEIAHTSVICMFITYLVSITSTFFIFIRCNYLSFNELMEYALIYKFNYYYLFDFYTFLAKFVVVVCFLINLHFSKYNYCFNLSKIVSIEYVPIMGFAVTVGLLAISSNDLFIIFILFEIMSFIMIYLIVVNPNSVSIESAIKFFFLNSFVGALGFLGILILYLLNGFFSTNLDIIATAFFHNFYFDKTFFLNNDIYLKIGCFLIFINFFFKFGIFPVHIFVVNIYSSLSMFGVFFVSTTLKLIYFFIFIKIIYYCFGSFFCTMFSPFMLIIALITYILGVLGAYNETNIKKFLAYSSISHSGFMLFSLGGIDITSNLAFMLFYFLIYVFSNILLFSVVLSYIDLKNNNNEIFINFNDLYLLNYSISAKKFYSTNVLVLNKFILTISILILMGLPPVMGFAAKYFIFLNLFNNNYQFFVFLALIFSTISGIYYFSLILGIWYNKADLNSFSHKLINLELAEVPNANNIRFVSIFFLFFVFFGVFLFPIDINFLLDYLIKFIRSSNPWL